MQRLPGHEGRSLREGGNLVPHPAPYFHGNWFPGARPPSLHAADPGGGQAQAGSHLEPVGGWGWGHSPSRREGPTGQVGAGGRRLHLTPGTLRLTEQPRQEARLLKVAPPSPCDRLSPPGEEAVHRWGVKLAGFRVTGGVQVPLLIKNKSLHPSEPPSTHL